MTRDLPYLSDRMPNDGTHADTLTEIRARADAAAKLGIDVDTLAHLDRTFPDDACESLGRSTQDYYSTHGHYVPTLAKLLLVERHALVLVRERVKALEEALVKHGEHMSGCAVWDSVPGPCVCGLNALIEGGTE